MEWKHEFVDLVLVINQCGKVVPRSDRPDPKASVLALAIGEVVLFQSTGAGRLLATNLGA